MEHLKQDIAAIIEDSHPGCSQRKECNGNCGECGAERVLVVFLRWLTQHGNQGQVDLLEKERGRQVTL